MNITFDNLTIEITRNEAYTLYSTIKHGLEDRIRDHWKNYPDSYEQQEGDRLDMLRELARFTNNNFNYDQAELKKLLASLTVKPD